MGPTCTPTTVVGPTLTCRDSTPRQRTPHTLRKVWPQCAVEVFRTLEYTRGPDDPPAEYGTT